MKASLLTVLVVLASASGLALAQDAGKKPAKKAGAKTVSVRLAALSKSGESGTAKLTSLGADKTRVEISLKGGPKGTPQPAHVHEGTCAKLNPQPKYGLENVVDGKSTTEVPVGLDKLTAGGLAINVHKSGQEIQTYVACGPIAKAGGAAKSSGKTEK
jgi:hypothetical protein